METQMNKDNDDILSLGDGYNIPRFVFGRCVVGTSEITINDYGTAGNISEMTAAGALKISSANAVDNGTGTGARTVLVRGLDSDWNIVQDIVTLNGQTAVALTNVVLHPFLIMVLTAGTGGCNTGNIYVGSGTVTSGVPAVVNVCCAATANQSRIAFMPIPDGYSCVVRNIHCSCNTAVSGNVYAKFKPFGGVYLMGATLNISSASTFDSIDILTPAFDSKTLIKLSCALASGTGTVSAGMNIVLYKKGR